ncbi:hypothetical protein BH24ACT7_BH24ACT7_04330 [soil metagenome]
MVSNDQPPPDQPHAEDGTVTTDGSRPSRTRSISRKVGVLLVGVPVLLLGIALIPLPGPGTLVVLAGLAILSLEFAWAERLSGKIKDGFRTLFDRIFRHR